MTRRFDVHMVVAMLAVVFVSMVSVPHARAQDSQAEDVFSDVELPDVVDDEPSSVPEELPLGNALPDGRLDDLPNDPAGRLPEDPSVSLSPDARSLDTSLSNDRLSDDSLSDDSLSEDALSSEALSDEALSDEVFSNESLPLEEDIDVGQAELVPDETVRERYPDGSVRIERGVSLDESDNYINHGPWKMWDEEGNLLVEGSYRSGERHGRWVRWYQPDEAELFRTTPFSMFTPPFRSEADFREGKLEGHWMVTDKHDRKVSDWQFAEGRRHGPAVWWYPNSTKMRELTYEFGQPDGELIEWNENAEVITRVEYQDGRRLDKTTRQYKDGQKQVEGMVLHARLAMKDPDDWWKASLATYTREGKDQKHGHWTAWYPKGQKKFTGEFVYGQQTGEFSWWYANGQVSLQGAYEHGAKVGAWTWWHETGLKSIQGFYEANSPVGRWIWWHENGRVAQRVDFSGEGEPRVVAPPATAVGRRSSSRESITVGRRGR